MAKLVNAIVLMQLADVQSQQTAASHGVTNPDLAASIAELAAKRKKDATDAAAGEILNLMENADGFIVQQSQTISSLKDQIAKIDALCAAVNRARQYGNETMNYTPLMRATGMAVGNPPTGVAKEVPKDWEPRAAAAPAAASTTAAS